MHVLTIDFNGNPNVGLYGFCTDKFCLLGSEVSKRIADDVSKALGVPVLQTTICGTSLIGVFVAGNSNKIIVPSIVFDSELEFLKKNNIDVTVIDTKLTALGNNLLVNDTGCLANPDFSSDVKKRIREALGVPLKPGTIAGLPTVGSLAALNSDICLTHPDIDNEELEKIENLLGIKVKTGTVNMGVPFISSGAICNDSGFVIGSVSGGPEVAWFDEVMGYLEKYNKN
ncbi:translation initiation factor IF-6 [Candidatus Woesearchaeota archaeon]|jgi:translation initiation factor 6|nr:translation initiation factor IF-6 [Candidatus Woesearchaeota archaeon]MBT6520058.1 translation initiation factor IF-6 [Candidatus Woesearchaeota archaeon]MBT7368441.1 translation initiation factor IF-6 [Candidatus Woesearchaeota archaeon]